MTASCVGVGSFLTSYNFDISYDPSLLNPTSIAYAGALAPAMISGMGTIAPGFFNVGEFTIGLPLIQVSLIEPFTLFTLTFDTLMAGVSPLYININPLSSQGITINYDPTFDVTTESGSIKVPEPSSLLLLGTAGMIAWRRKMIAQG